MSPKNNPVVSIIIPTYNSEKNLSKCLESLNQQHYHNIEIIVVDQSSEDNTQKIAKKFECKLIKLPKPKFYSPPTRSRNEGAKLAKGEILLHLDSDMKVSGELIKEIAEIFSFDPKVGALVVHEEDITNGFWSKCKAFERKCYWGNDNIESARVVRKHIFNTVGGYDESLNSGEDFDIHRRYKKICKISFCNNVIYHDLGNLSFFKTISKKYNYGKTASKYFEKYNTSGQSILYEQVKCYLRHLGDLVKSPVIGTGSIVLKILEFASGGFGLIIGNYEKR